MNKIGTEEHFWTQYFMDYFQARKKYPKAESVLDEKGEKDVEVVEFGRGIFFMVAGHDY